MTHFWGTKHFRYTNAAPNTANKIRRIAMINPSTPPIIVSAELEFKAALDLEIFPWVSHLQVLSWIVGLLLVEMPSGLTVGPPLGGV
jgi:hypothetical protein